MSLRNREKKRTKVSSYSADAWFHAKLYPLSSKLGFLQRHTYRVKSSQSGESLITIFTPSSQFSGLSEAIRAKDGTFIVMLMTQYKKILVWLPTN